MNKSTFLTIADIREVNKKFPNSFMKRAIASAYPAVIYFCGGCKGMNDTDKADMTGYHLAAFNGYNAVALSGGTRVKNSLTVTDIPGILKYNNPSITALGIMPRTDTLRLLNAHGTLAMNERETWMNRGMDHLLMVQDGCENVLKWDGDTNTYLNFMATLVKNNFVAGSTLWNGGGTSEKQIRETARRKFPVFIINGSGEAADRLSKEKTFVRQKNVYVVQREKPEELNALLKKLKFIEN